ncbi:MAG: ATP-binding cassette domain-containing protein [Humibacter sp.]
MTEPAEDARVTVATAPRGTRGGTRARATKGAGVVDRANAIVQADTVAIQDTTTTEDTVSAETAAPETAAPETAAPETAAPETAAPESIAAEAVSPDTTTDAPTRTDAPAGSPAGPATLAAESAAETTPSESPASGASASGAPTENEDVDTGEMPAQSAPVDEHTGSRQRITLFGRRRRASQAAAAAAAAAAAEQQAGQGSELLAELVRETESAERRASSLAEPTIDGEAIAEETVDRETIDHEAVEQETLPRARRAATTRVFPPARPAPAATAPVVLAVSGLHKRYGDVVAVDGVSLNIRAGSMYGIVGPNGAGKTTTLSIITGLLRADSGTVLVNGVDARKHPRDAKRAIGVLPDHLRTFDRLTGAQLLYYAGTLRGLDAATTRQRSADLATAFGIEDAMGRLVADYSAGMTKKVSLAAAMIHSPRLLVLDEPFEGVDPVSAATVTGILQRYVDAGGTVLLSSHGMDLVQRICDSVAIIIGGVVLDAGPVDQVRGEKTLEEHFVELAGGRKAAEGLEWLHSFSD